MSPEPSLAAKWSLGEDAFAAIVRDMQAIAPTTIVEFGSGASSVRLAQAFPNARIFSLESSAEFCQRARSMATAHGVTAARLEIALRPLGFRRIGAAIYETYAPGPFPAVVDAVLIDGPPYWTGRGREACLHDVFPNLRVGGRVYLDDHHRAQEQRVVKNWLRCYPDVFRVSSYDAGHGIGVLEKLVAGPDAPQIDFVTTVDSWLVHANRRLKRLIRREPRSVYEPN